MASKLANQKQLDPPKVEEESCSFIVTNSTYLRSIHGKVWREECPNEG
jgi:hypothetical protein